MIDPDLAARLDTLEHKIDAALQAAITVRRWMFWTGVITVILIVLPLVGLVFAIPQFLSTYSQIGNITGY